MEEQKHKRRIHYSGKYPRHFAEKYKELNPEKYGEEVAHVIAKGNTPAGMHIPIMVEEILDVLAIQPGEQGFDGTLGYGGHTLAMLDKLAGQGRLYSGDIDPIESKKTEARIREKGFGEEIWQLRNMNFCQIDELAQEVGGFDFVLADLGVSSMQIDNPERGFTFKSDGPLDLRLNPEAGITAAERLAVRYVFDELDIPLLYTDALRIDIRSRHVLECHHVAGQSDYLLKVLVADTDELESFISDFLKGIPGVVSTTTIINLTTLKEEINV